MVNASNKAKAEEAMFKSVRELLTVKVTLPLGNPNYKLIHTNSFIFCDLSGYVDLENFDVIAKAMNSTFNRYTTYKKNRWYVEAVTINQDNQKGTMELTLNPFPSTLKEYHKAYTDYTNAYYNAQNKAGAGGSSGSSSNTKSTGSYCKGGQGATIDNLVKNICGNVADPLQRCKAIHEWLRKNVRYSSYECCKYSCGGSPTKCYENRTHLNCADTAVLTCSMMLSAGLNAYIVHRTYNGGHFWCIIEINGRKYASDQTGDGSAFNTVWRANGRTSVSNGGEYSHRESGFHTC